MSVILVTEPLKANASAVGGVAAGIAIAIALGVVMGVGKFVFASN